MMSEWTEVVGSTSQVDPCESRLGLDPLSVLTGVCVVRVCVVQG